MTSQTSASDATVETERPQRYGKQLVSHLGRGATGEWDEETSVGQLTFTGGHAELSCTAGALVLHLSAAADHLERLEDVVGRHLVRFGGRDELVVQWIREDGAAGSVQRTSED